VYVRADLCSRIDRNRAGKAKIGLRSKNRFELRRSQIVLASARKESARRIARTSGCDDQKVRNVIKKFNAAGLDVL
jgi:hypothetical protein